MEFSIVSFVCGVAIAAILVWATLAIISLCGRPSLFSWACIVLLSVIVLISGTRLCMAVDTLVSLNDSDNSITEIADDATTGLSSIAQSLGAEQISDNLSSIKEIALGSVLYKNEMLRKESKRVLWRSIFLIIGSTLLLGGIGAVAAEKEAGRSRSSRRIREGETRISRSESSYRRHRR